MFLLRVENDEAARLIDHLLIGFEKTEFQKKIQKFFKNDLQS